LFKKSSDFIDRFNCAMQFATDLCVFVTHVSLLLAEITFSNYDAPIFSRNVLHLLDFIT